MAFYRCGGGISSAELYDALQYSGIVNKNMTVEQMLEELEKYFPETYPVLINIANVTTEYSTTRETVTSYSSDKIDLTRAKTLEFTVDCSFKSGGYFYDIATFSAGISSVNSGELEKKVEVWEVRNGENAEKTYTKSITVTLDVSALEGEYYVGVQVYKGRDDNTSNSVRNVQGIATITELERIVT